VANGPTSPEASDMPLILAIVALVAALAAWRSELRLLKS
jgi:hypothetical protein